MKTMIYSTLAAVIVTFFPGMTAHAKAQDGATFYYRKSTYHPYREFKYLRLDRNIRYVSELNVQDLAEYIGATGVSRLDVPQGIEYSLERTNDNGTVDKYEIRYYILTSQEDAELYALDILGGSTHGYRHVSDYDMELGDNAWTDGSMHTVFTRENVCVDLFGRAVHEEGNDIRCARAIDDYIMSLDKADTAEKLPIPTIENVEIISFTEKTGQVNGEEQISFRYDLAVTAHDAGSDTLYYQTINNSYSTTETDGTIPYFAMTKEDSCKVYVMNEHHLVASKDIFDSRRGER